MNNLETIKQKILQLDPGSFQNLCESCLFEMYKTNIVTLGGEPGSRKTTKGTPDAYLKTPEGKYILAEYTTQQNSLFKKIKSDIQKCLNREITGIEYSQISKIVYCHTTSNITTKQDNELTILCKEKGIELEIIGIDSISQMMYHNPLLCHDFLDISLDNVHIQSPKEFIENYNKSPIATPLDTKFQYRKKELEDIKASFLDNDIVILYGSSGVGKTRLALQYANYRHEINNEIVYCINNGTSLEDKLKYYINDDKNYVFVFDDAERLSELNKIVQFTRSYNNIKILVTVREYALQKVISKIQGLASCKVIKIDPLSDSEIKEIIKNILDIPDSIYLEKLLNFSKGNIRIAVLVGKMEIKATKKDYPKDKSQLYDIYYSDLINQGILKEQRILLVIGIVALLGNVDLDNLANSLEIIKEKGMGKEEFIENVNKLHDFGIIDIYENKIAWISDKCLSDYLLKYIFYDKRILSLSNFIINNFKRYTDRTIYIVSILIQLNLIEFVTKEVRYAWEEIKDKEPDLFEEFQKEFYSFRKTETLLNVMNKNLYTDNDILKILSGFVYTKEVPNALDILFRRFINNPNAFNDFENKIKTYFAINSDSIRMKFAPQIALLNKIKEYSQDWDKDFMTYMFLDIAQEYLKFHSTGVENLFNKKYIYISNIPIILNEDTKKYRKLVWKYLDSIAKKDKYRPIVKQILSGYGKNIEDVSISTLQYDFKYIKKLFNTYFSEANFENHILAKNIYKILESKNISTDSFFEKYLNGDNIEFLKRLESLENDGLHKDETKLEKIEQYIQNCSFDDFKRLIDDLHSYNSAGKISESLEITFDFLYKNSRDLFKQVVKYYIDQNTPNNICPDKIVHNLFEMLPESEVYDLIENKEYDQKERWQFSYFYELPTEKISEQHLKLLYDFLKNSTANQNSHRDILFLEKYKKVDKYSLIKGCKIILSRINESPNMASMYFTRLFNMYSDKPDTIISKFNSNLEVLEEAYFAVLQNYGNQIDDKLFLKKFYQAKPTVLNSYIKYLANKIDNANELSGSVRCFFDLDDYLEIYNTIFDKLLEECKFPELSIFFYLEVLLAETKDTNILKKQDKWISQLIELFSRDRTKMPILFSGIADLDIERKKEYVLLFLKENLSLEDFKALPLKPTHWSWTGSIIPLYQQWLDYYESIKLELNSTELLGHKKYIEEQIEYLEDDIAAEKRKEFMEQNL